MKQRILTAIIAAALFIPIIIIGGLPFTLAILFVSTVAMYELLKMKRIPPFSFIGFMSLLLMWSLFIPPNWLDIAIVSHLTKMEVFVFIIFILLMFMVISKNKYTYDIVGFIILSSVYVGFGFHYLMMTRLQLENGLALIFFVLFVIWATDSGAYFVGRKLGRRKLWPTISPKKTIEGSIGGIGCALLIGISFQLLFPIFPSLLLAVIVVLVCSIFGQVGDLVESAIKRHYSIKDSGNILPGHGGILDRFDSLIYVMPILHLLQLI